VLLLLRRTFSRSQLLLQLQLQLLLNLLLHDVLP
jgi:hypothetical protein